MEGGEQPLLSEDTGEYQRKQKSSVFFGVFNGGDRKTVASRKTIQGAVLTGTVEDEEIQQEPQKRVSKSIIEYYSKKMESQTVKRNRVSDRGKILLATVGFFSDAYDLLVINIVLVILSSLYSLSPGDKSIITTAALIGAILGQLSFGFLADIIGRFTAWMFTVVLMIIAAIGSAASFTFGGGSLGLAICLGFWRFLLGLGIGGEYPLAATVSSESSVDPNTRGRNITFVFAAQGWGNLVASVLVLILLAVFPSDGSYLDAIWRIAFAFGAVPCIASIYHRYLLFQDHMEEARSNPDANVKKTASKGMLLIVSQNWKKLLGTAGSWLIFDIVFYANTLFQATLLKSLGYTATDLQESLIEVCKFSCIVAGMSLPGYYSAMFLIDRVGRRVLQQVGFLLLALTYLIMGLTYKQLLESPAAFVILYGLSFYFSNLGPNTTTYVVPSEVYPEEVRATCHGISAAAGKLGGVIGASLMPFSLEYFGSEGTFLICFGISVLGLLLSLTDFVPESNGKPLESRVEIEMLSS